MNSSWFLHSPRLAQTRGCTAGIWFEKRESHFLLSPYLAPSKFWRETMAGNYSRASHARRNILQFNNSSYASCRRHTRGCRWTDRDILPQRYIGIFPMSCGHSPSVSSAFSGCHDTRLSLSLTFSASSFYIGDAT